MRLDDSRSMSPPPKSKRAVGSTVLRVGFLFFLLKGLAWLVAPVVYTVFVR